MGEETGLIVPCGFINTHVRETLDIQNICDLESLIATGGPAINLRTDPRECLFLCLYILCFLDTFTHNCIEMMIIITRVNNEINDILICNNAEGAEENKEGNICLDTRDRCTQKMNLGILRMIHNLHSIVLRYLVIVRPNALNLNHFNLLRGIAIVAEDKRAVL